MEGWVDWNEGPRPSVTAALVGSRFGVTTRRSLWGAPPELPGRGRSVRHEPALPPTLAGGKRRVLPIRSSHELEMQQKGSASMPTRPRWTAPLGHEIGVRRHLGRGRRDARFTAIIRERASAPKSFRGRRRGLVSLSFGEALRSGVCGDLRRLAEDGAVLRWWLPPTLMFAPPRSSTKECPT
jgi:hypothetical protein